jgi:nitrogen regulatory protein PII
MQMMIAVIPAHMLETVRRCLYGMGLREFLSAEINGYGQVRSHTEIYRGTALEVWRRPRVIPSDQVRQVVRTLTALTGSGSEPSVEVGAQGAWCHAAPARDPNIP